MKTDKDLLRLIGAGSDTPAHVACRCFAADLRRVYEAGKEELRQQLVGAIAACKQKDEALDYVDSENASEEVIRRCSAALSIQPDDSALKAWIGEPVGEVKKHTGSLKDMAIIVWTGEQPAEGTKLYSPKELK